jgi:hypothetical protein
MVDLRLGRYALSVYAAIAIVAGCGVLRQPQDEVPSYGMQGAVPQGAVRSPMPQGTWIPMLPSASKRAGWLSPAARVPGQPLLYVSQYYFIISCCPDAYVFIYPEEGNHQFPIGIIDVGGEPWGLYVDRHRNLYVANQVGTVTVYPPGSTSPSLTYYHDLYRPLYVIVDSSGAHVFVSQAARNYQGGGTVVEYQLGSTDRYQVLQTPGIEADGMDFDRQGNLYVAYRSSDGTGSIEEFAPGTTQGKILGMSLNQPQGVIVDKAGNIIVVETANTSIGPHIDVFPPGQLTPSVELPIPNIPNQLAIRQTEPSLFIAAEEGPVYGIRYPFLGEHSRLYVKEELAPPYVEGVALSNGQHF